MNHAAALQAESVGGGRNSRRVSAEPAVAAEVGNQSLQALLAGSMLDPGLQPGSDLRLGRAEP